MQIRGFTKHTKLEKKTGLRTLQISPKAATQSELRELDSIIKHGGVVQLGPGLYEVEKSQVFWRKITGGRHWKGRKLREEDTSQYEGRKSIE